MLNSKIESNLKVIKDSSCIPNIKMKAIKYLTLTNITLLGFKTTKDIALIEQLNLCKENIMTMFKSDILNSSGIQTWQVLLFIVLSIPAVYLNQNDKSKKNKK